MRPGNYIVETIIRILVIVMISMAADGAIAGDKKIENCLQEMIGLHNVEIVTHYFKKAISQSVAHTADGSSKTLTVRISPTLKDQIDALSRATNLTQGEIIGRSFAMMQKYFQDTKFLVPYSPASDLSQFSLSELQKELNLRVAESLINYKSYVTMSLRVPESEIKALEKVALEAGRSQKDVILATLSFADEVLKSGNKEGVDALELSIIRAMEKASQKPTEKVALSFQIPENLRNKINQASEKIGVSATQFVAGAIGFAYETWDAREF